MTGRFRLTPRAREDLKSIGRYTLKTWGKAQRDRYLRALDQRFQWLADHPDYGKDRSDIAKGYYCFLQGRHLMFYLRDSKDNVDIIGIPHAAMDLLNYFDV